MGSLKAKSPDWLTGGFKEAAHRWYFDPDAPCWLAQFDEAERPCEAHVEAFHFIGRQRLRNALYAALPVFYYSDEETVEKLDRESIFQAAEWDPRNGGPGCTVHHRAYDSHMATGLLIPAQEVPRHVLSFASDWGMEAELQKHCSGDISDRIAAIVDVPVSSPAA